MSVEFYNSNLFGSIRTPGSLVLWNVSFPKSALTLYHYISCKSFISMTKSVTKVKEVSDLAPIRLESSIFHENDSKNFRETFALFLTSIVINDLY